MQPSERSPEELRRYLKRRMTQQEIAAEGALIKSKRVVKDWNRLNALLESGDEIWEWEWFADPRMAFQAAYSLGWCIIRDSRIIDSYCHSSS